MKYDGPIRAASCCRRPEEVLDNLISELQAELHQLHEKESRIRSEYAGIQVIVAERGKVSRKLDALKVAKSLVEEQ